MADPQLQGKDSAPDLGGFSDFAEPFCAGWNAYKDRGRSMEASGDPREFMRLVMDAFADSGSQRAARMFGKDLQVVPREVAERLAEALDEAADVIATWAGHNHSKYHDALRVYDEFRAVFPKAGEAFDARAAGCRVIDKHGDALRRLSDEAEEA